MSKLQLSLLFAAVLTLACDPGSAREWHISVVEASQSDMGYDTSIAIDSAGLPHISYYGNWSIRHAQSIGQLWNITRIEQILPQIVGRWNAVALDSRDFAHISYTNASSLDLKYCCWDGANWQIDTIDGAGSVGRYSSIAIDDRDRPHISYADRSKGDLKYAFRDGAGWTITSVDTVGDVGKYTSIALDSAGNPHISYCDFLNHDLRYARWDGKIWHLVSVDTIGDVGRFTSLELDACDNPHISYYDDSNQDLKYAFWNGSRWTRLIVDGDVDVGMFSSLALDSEDLPHISYYDKDNGDLKYAHWDGSALQVATVDAAGNVGKYSSIAVDDRDAPHIAYHDTIDALKYACLPAAPAPDIKIDGQDGPLRIPHTQSATLTLSVDAGSYLGVPHDWWIGGVRNGTALYCWNYPGQWIGTPVPIRAYGGPLVDLEDVLLARGRAPIGSWVFVFALDAWNGTCEGTYSDTVEVTVY